MWVMSSIMIDDVIMIIIELNFTLPLEILSVISISKSICINYNSKKIYTVYIYY